MASYPQRLGEPECRDYLRTGRCKYGESCKYHHPLDIQSGGGVRPIDPEAPAFPIRPDEPICQYYLKHGTCKFGQTCKFNHPPLPACPPVNDNVLPQRPDEPDCIYFLRNGRCKYGATCKYHHPLNGRRRSLSGENSDGNAPQQVRLRWLTSLERGYLVADRVKGQLWDPTQLSFPALRLRSGAPDKWAASAANHDVREHNNDGKSARLLPVLHHRPCPRPRLPRGQPDDGGDERRELAEQLRHHDEQPRRGGQQQLVSARRRARRDRGRRLRGLQGRPRRRRQRRPPRRRCDVQPL
mmetsp:Transcript_27830/g.55640  ORF Transcript_27830/g.55640 Transcript_27830/m.55640 type:complete len:297 (+) Transcript_27830:235-1125(+)